MKTFERKQTYKRDTLGRDGRQHVLPWAAGLVISVNEAAKRIGCSYEVALSLCKEGVLQAWPITDKKKSPWRVSKDSVELYVERKMKKYDVSDDELNRRIDKRISGLSGVRNPPGSTSVQE